MLHDADIREPLFDFLEDRYGTVRFLEEKTIGRSRADVLMVTADALYGLEIKSDADSYQRLSRQIPDYDACFDFNYAVVGLTHTEHIWEHLPPHWGIITAERLVEGMDFYIDRKPRPNPKVDATRKLCLLWRRELDALLRENGLPRYAGKSRRVIAGKLLASVDAETLRRQISRELFERDYTTLPPPRRRR